MTTFFRKLLIRLGKAIPFLTTIIMVIGYIETIYAITTNNIMETSTSDYVYHLPISDFISHIIYIDWFDVLLIWILCFALELCKYAFRCAWYITLALCLRFALERFYIENGIVIGICAFMALYGLYCAYGGLKVLTNKQ